MRENQRKSRARKQEYIRELEERLAACQKQAQHKDIDQRLAIQRVEAENRHLKKLLVSLGISADLVQQYLQAADQDAAVARKVAIPALQRPTETASASSSSNSGARSSCTPSSASSEQATGAQHSPVADSTCTSTCTSAEQQSPQQTESTDPPLCCPIDKVGLATLPPNDIDIPNTTLCAIAEELISQYNTRGADTEEIRRRLWAGFRKGKSGDGCRVQNQVLFQVLDEISNNV